MQLFERTATFLVLIGIAVPYLLIMNGTVAIVGLFVESAKSSGTPDPLSLAA